MPAIASRRARSRYRPAAQQAQRRLQLDAGDRQRVDAERGDVAEEAGERDRGGRHAPPARPVFQRQPQREPAQRDAQAEQVVDEPPQQDAVIEQQEREQRPRPPASEGDAVEPQRAAGDQREGQHQEELAGERQRHQARQERHDDIRREVGQRRPAHRVKIVAALGDQMQPRQVVRVVDQRRQHGREQRHADHRQQQREGGEDPGASRETPAVRHRGRDQKSRSA